MYDAYFEQRGLIPEGRLCDVGHEELERDPVGVIGSSTSLQAGVGRNWLQVWQRADPFGVA